MTDTQHARSHLIDGEWIAGEGEGFNSADPATGDVVWRGRHATPREVDRAVAVGRSALDGWTTTPITNRVAIAERFAEILKDRRAALAETISREVGKPLWESLAEVDAMAAKVAISIAAQRERRADVVESVAGGTAATRYRPIGVVGVLGPFNFPGHLPNGHIVPALLAGNAVVFKPSELSPLVGARMAEAWEAAGLPPGVLNVVQGGRDTGSALAGHAGVDGVFFTGSVSAGRAIHRACAGEPWKLLALEMGGNNPLVVWDASDLDAAAFLTIQSAYVTAGQRCSCARRLIVPAGSAGDRFVARLARAITRIRVGPWTDRPEPFLGPVISADAAARLLRVRDDLRERGGVEIVPMAPPGTPTSSSALDGIADEDVGVPGAPSRRSAFLSPGLMDVTAVPDRDDAEHFGPFLQLIRVRDFDAAIAEANRTSFGLCAGLLSDDRSLFDRFLSRVRAGVVNFNRATTGASSKLPFGGVGLSGNHRPSAAFACDYCSDPVASLEASAVSMPTERPPGSGFD